MRLARVAAEVARVAAASLLLPLAISIVCVAFSKAGIFAPPKYELLTSESYTSAIVLAQPLFAALVPWFVFARTGTDSTWKGAASCAFKAILGVIAADWLWILGFIVWACVVTARPIENLHIGVGMVTGFVFQIAAILAISLLAVLIVVGPGSAVAAFAALFGLADFTRGRARWIAAGSLMPLAYLGLLTATCFAGSARFSGAAYASEIPKILSILWLTGASIGCAVVLASVSVQPNCGRVRRFVFLGAATLGFLVGGGILFHLSMERAGGELWPPLFLPPETSRVVVHGLSGVPNSQ